MQETLHNHNTSVSVDGRPICYLRFAVDINLMSGSNGDLQDLANRLVDRVRAYGMEVSTEKKKSKIMTNSTNDIGGNISISGQKLEEATSFKYLEATMPRNRTCLAETRKMIA